VAARTGPLDVVMCQSALYTVVLLWILLDWKHFQFDYYRCMLRYMLTIVYRGRFL